MDLPLGRLRQAVAAITARRHRDFTERALLVQWQTRTLAQWIASTGMWEDQAAGKAAVKAAGEVSVFPEDDSSQGGPVKQSPQRPDTVQVGVNPPQHAPASVDEEMPGVQAGTGRPAPQGDPAQDAPPGSYERFMGMMAGPPPRQG